MSRRTECVTAWFRTCVLAVALMSCVLANCGRGVPTGGGEAPPSGPAEGGAPVHAGPAQGSTAAAFTAPAALHSALGNGNVCLVPGAASPPPSESMFVFSASLHHGKVEFDIPHKRDLERAGDLANQSMQNPAASIVMIAAAPCSSDLFGRGYLFGPETIFRTHLHGDWAAAEAALCGGHGRTVILVGANFQIVSAAQEDFPSAIAGSEEGVHYGVFDVLHRASGHHYYFVTGTVEHDNSAHRRDQIAHLVDRGTQLAQRFPTFVGGDFNLGADSGGDDGATVAMVRSRTRALTLDPSTTCALPTQSFSYRIVDKIQLTLIDTPGTAPVDVRGYLLDPRSPLLPPSPQASSISLKGGKEGEEVGLVHPMSGVLVHTSCVNSEGGLTWSCAGPVPGLACTHVEEPSDPDTWNDNYLCADQDRGLQWSMHNPIPGMRCTNIVEASEPDGHHWSDNYLCAPTSSKLVYRWSGDGPVGGSARSCVQWIEPSDPHTWQDNFLCAEPCGGRDQACCDRDCNAGLTCESGTCRKSGSCGGKDQPCCGVDCSSGFACESGTCRKSTGCVGGCCPPKKICGCNDVCMPPAACQHVCNH